MGVNVNPQLKSEGKLYLDGEEVIEAKSVNIKITINSTTSKTLGAKHSKTRTNGYDVSVSITRYKVNKFSLKLIKDYLDKGKTPEFTIQAINNDSGSDFFKNLGEDTVTVTGAVPTGDLNLLDLDASSTDNVEETITFTGGTIT